MEQLVILAPNWLGDAVMALPAIADVRRSAPRARIAVAARPAVAPLFALVPGAAYGGAKRWPPESFAELAASLAADGVTCVLVGSAADAATAHDVEQGFLQRPGGGTRQTIALLNVVGRTDLPTLAGLLTHGRALVTNDSGAMHLA